MSVLIKDMEKPKSCYVVIDGEVEYCPFVNTNDDCVLQLEKGICEGTWEEQYGKCPLVEAPEPCEDAVSRNWIRQDISDSLNQMTKIGIAVDSEWLWEKINDALDNAPSVTPKAGQTEIVLCKDCEHWKNEHLCESLSRFGSFETKADFYCGFSCKKVLE